LRSLIELLLPAPLSNPIRSAHWSRRVSPHS